MGSDIDHGGAMTNVIIQCLLNYIDERLDDLRISPSNRLEKLSGDRNDQHSIRINDQWRICFEWRNGDAYEVEMTDYH